MVDPGVAMRFRAHIGVAEGELERIESIPARLDALPSGDGISQSLMEELALDWAKGWENAWTQLAEARAVVVAAGRDTSAYDAARAAAGDIYLHTAKGTAVRLGNSVQLTWRNGGTRTARDASAALRTAMSDVPFEPQAPPIQFDLRSSGAQTLQYVLYAAGALLATYLVFRLLT